jgi:ribosomal protein S18 acetylase RimI-like enzyme
MQFAIRAATARDYDALLPIIDEVDALHREQFPHIFQKPDGPPRDRAYILGVLADEAYGLFVAQAEGPDRHRAEGEILGFVQVAIHDAPPLPILVPRRVANVENLAIREGFRRVGIGRSLIRRAERWAQERGASEIELTVYEFNQDALSFYHELGYNTSSRRMGKRLE